jgi:iron uptake system component EfeO
MTVKLQPGEFDITCGLLSNPRGKLRVTPSAASQAEAERPSLIAYVGALAEYRVFLALEAGTLEEGAQALVSALDTGDRAHAQVLYVQAHQAYKRIEPMAELFADLDTRLNARADYFERREADPGFIGFHRIEYGLFGAGEQQQKMRQLLPLANQLLADISELRERLQTLDVPPERLASASSKLLRRVAERLAGSGEDRYSHAELANLQGTWDGTKKIADLLAPLLSKASPALDRSMARHFDELHAAIDAGLEDASVEPLDVTQRQSLAGQVLALADEFGKVNGALGLE